MSEYFDIAFTPAITELQEQKGSRAHYASSPDPERRDEPHQLTDDELAMIASRNSFYMATVSETGWPYVQHRGGDAGFVTVLGPSTIGWLERTGNRQYVGTGNISATGRVALIFMDYPSRSRLKAYGLATYHPEPSPELLDRLGASGIRSDGAITVEILATDWNCPKYITPRYTADEVEVLTAELTERIAELEARLQVA